MKLRLASQLSASTAPTIKTTSTEANTAQSETGAGVVELKDVVEDECVGVVLIRVDVEAEVVVDVEDDDELSVEDEVEADDETEEKLEVEGDEVTEDETDVEVDENAEDVGDEDVEDDVVVAKHNIPVLL